MPNDSNPIDGQPWPLSAFLRDSPTWAPSGVVGAPVSAYGSGDLALSFDIVSGTSVTPKLALGRGRSRGGRYERTGSPWASGLSGTAPQQGSAAYGLNTASNPRRDRIVLRRDAALQAVYPIILIGTPAASPVAPALTQVEAGVWDTPLNSWTLPGGSSTAPTNIVDERAWVDAAGGRGLSCWTEVGRDANFPSPQQGDTVQIASDGSIHVRDSGSWEVWDTRWQTYTPEVSASAAPPFVAATIGGDGTLLGRYLRRGRAVDLSVFFRVGTATSYNGVSSIVQFSYPPGLIPGDGNFLNNFGHADGTAYTGTTAGDLMLFVFHNYQATAANRRMFLLDGTQRAAQAGSGAINLTGGGRFAQFTTTYEIA